MTVINKEAKRDKLTSVSNAEQSVGVNEKAGVVMNEDEQSSQEDKLEGVHRRMKRQKQEKAEEEEEEKQDEKEKEKETKK